MGQDQETEELAQGGFVPDQGVAVEPEWLHLVRHGGQYPRVRGGVGVQQQGPGDQGLKGIGRGPADGGLERDPPVVGGQALQGVAEAHLEAASSALVAMDGGGEDQAGIGLQQALQQGSGDGRRLVHQQQVGRLGGLAQGVRGLKA